MARKRVAGVALGGILALIVLGCSSAGRTEIPKQASVYGMHPVATADLQNAQTVENNADQKARIWAAYMTGGIRYRVVAENGQVRISLGEPIVPASIEASRFVSRDRLPAAGASGDQIGYVVTEIAIELPKNLPSAVQTELKRWPLYTMTVSASLQQPQAVHLIPLRALLGLLHRLYSNHTGQFSGTAYVLGVRPNWEIVGADPPGPKRYSESSTMMQPIPDASGQMAVEVDLVAIEGFVGPGAADAVVREVPAAVWPQWLQGVTLPANLSSSAAAGPSSGDSSDSAPPPSSSSSPPAADTTTPPAASSDPPPASTPSPTPAPGPESGWTETTNGGRNGSGWTQPPPSTDPPPTEPTRPPGSQWGSSPNGSGSGSNSNWGN